MIDNHIEYRAGLFQGLRKPGTGTEVSGENMFRFAARVQINILDAETSFFYGGTYLGKKKILSVGGAVDIQDKYKHFAADAFVDMPAGPGSVTAQVNFGTWDGGTFITALPKQSATMAEAGYRIDAIQLAPIAKFEQRNFSDTDQAETRVGGGSAFFPNAHNIDLKHSSPISTPSRLRPALLHTATISSSCNGSCTSTELARLEGNARLQLTAKAARRQADVTAIVGGWVNRILTRRAGLCFASVTF